MGPQVPEEARSRYAAEAASLADDLASVGGHPGEPLAHPPIGKCRQSMSRPPFTSSVVPVMYWAAGEARNRIGPT